MDENMNNDGFEEFDELDNKIILNDEDGNEVEFEFLDVVELDAGVGEGKKIFFFTYLVLVVTFSTFCIFPLVNYKRIEIEGERDSKFIKFVYSILIISVTALPIFISMVMTLLFKGLDIFMSFAILETFVYAAFAFFYVAFCDDAKAVSEEQHVFTSNCILFDDARKMKKMYKW